MDKNSFVIPNHLKFDRMDVLSQHNIVDSKEIKFVDRSEKSFPKTVIRHDLGDGSFLLETHVIKSGKAILALVINHYDKNGQLLTILTK